MMKKKGSGFNDEVVTPGPQSGEPHTPTPQEELTFEAAYKKHLAEAKAIAEHEIVEFKGYDALVLGNAIRGVVEVVGAEGDFLHADALKHLQVKGAELRAAIGIAQGFSFVSLLVDRDVSSDGAIERQYVVVAPARRKLLAAAESLVASGVIDDADVAPVRPGHGKRDAGEDVLKLVSLFRKRAKAIAGKHPITAAELDAAEQAASALLMLVKPAGAVRERKLPADAIEHIELRARFWTLLNRRYELLWKVGAWIWGWKVDEHVPALLSRKLGSRRSGDAATGSTGAVKDAVAAGGEPAAAPKRKARASKRRK